MLRDDRIYEFAAQRLKSGECAFLVCSHELTVANHIGREDGGKAALDTFLEHVLQLRLEAAV